MPGAHARASPLVHLVVATLAVLVGAYLLAWAWRWPHSDHRNAWASFLGTGGLAVGALSLVFAIRPAHRFVRAGLALCSAATISVSVMGLVVIGADQRQACGDVLPVCDSLLPGL